MKDDDVPPRNGSVLQFPAQSRSELADEVAGLSRRFDAFAVEMREGLKDILAVLRVDRSARADVDDRASQLERDIIEHRQQIGQLEQQAKKRRKAGKK
jgi:hypothetical protein